MTMAALSPRQAAVRRRGAAAVNAARQIGIVRALELEPLAAAAFVGFIALVCIRRQLSFNSVMIELAKYARAPRPNSREWQAASAARELALYLTATLGNIPPAVLARAVGLTRAAVTMALRRVEDRRDDAAYLAELILMTRMVTGRDG